MRGLVKDEDRHGNVRYYFRVKGQPKIRLREPFDTPAFREELRAAQLGIPYRASLPVVADKSPVARAGTLKWLALEYLRRGCVGLAESTVAAKRYCLEHICETPIEGKAETYGRMPYRLMIADDVEYLRDLRAEGPNGANFQVRTLSAMFNWACKKRGGGAPLATSNPAAGVEKYKIVSDGHHTWTMGEIGKYREFHKPGTRQHLALTLLLFTGLRVSDAARAGRQHLYQATNDEGEIETRLRLTPIKTAVSSGAIVDILVLPPLLAAIEAVPKTQLAFIHSDKHKPYSGKVLGNMFRIWAKDAGLVGCSAHGLRKALATIAAEGGATGNQLMAMFGWTNTKQADAYTRSAERRRLASAGAKHLKLV